VTGADEKFAPSSVFSLHYQLLSEVSLRNVLINDRMASLLLEKCDLSFMSKASTSFLGALNSTSSISSFGISSFALIVWFFGTFLSPDLLSDEEVTPLSAF